MRQQQQDGGGGKQAKINNNTNDSSILTNESLNSGSNLFTAPNGAQTLNSSATPTSSYLQEQSIAGGDNSMNKPEHSSITTQINKILKKPKKDNEKIMLLSDDEF